MSLNDIITNCNVHECKITVETDYTRYMCFTRVGYPGSWIVCVTDGSFLWRLEFDEAELEACSKLVNQPTIENFLLKFGESFNSQDVTIAQVSNKITLSLVNGLTFDLFEATSADTKFELKYIIFNLADQLKSTEGKLVVANEAVNNLHSQLAAGGTGTNTLMDLGPKKIGTSVKMKPTKEGMSVLNPLSKKRKAPQDEEDENEEHEEKLSEGEDDNDEYTMIESIVYEDGLDESTDNGLQANANSDMYDNPDAGSAVWHHEGVLLLVKVYGQLRKRFLVRGMKKKHVWEMIALKLNREGLKITASKCENKWKNLMRGHRLCLKNGDPGKPCPYFDEITQVLETNVEDIEDQVEDEELMKEVTRNIDGKPIATFYWPRDAVLLLIKQYTKHKPYFSKPGMMKKHVWNLIAAEIEKRGHQVTASQCAGKWKNLTRQYRNALEADRTIDQDPNRGQFFNEVQDTFIEDDSDGFESSTKASSGSGSKRLAHPVEPHTTSKVEGSQIIKFLTEISRQEQKDQKQLLDKLGQQHREKLEQEERKMKLFESLMERLPPAK